MTPSELKAARKSTGISIVWLAANCPARDGGRGVSERAWKYWESETGYGVPADVAEWMTELAADVRKHAAPDER
jgi:hypothetical protein